MKLFVITLFSLLTVIQAKAQYTVIKVVGNPKNSKTQKTINVKDKINGEKDIAWGTEQIDKMVCAIWVGKDEKVFMPPQTAPASPKDSKAEQLAAFLLHSNSTSSALAGRGDITEPIPGAMQASANSNGKIVISKENKYLFNPKEFPQTNGGFFVQIDIPGQKPVIHVLKTRNDTLILNYSDIVTGSVDTTAKYKIGYYNKDAAVKTQSVTSFDPYFDITNETEDMIAACVLAYQGESMTKEAVHDSIYSIVYANSGKPNGISFNIFFNKYWQNK